MDKNLILKTLNKKAKDAGAHPPGASSAFVAAAQLAVGVLGAAILLVYPIGFLTLWVQIMRTYDYSAPEALYATSMVPTSVVAGGAIFVLLFAPVVAFLMVYAAFLHNWLFKKIETTQKEKTRHRRLWILLYVVAFTAGFLVPLGMIWYYGIWRDPPPHLGAGILFAALFFLWFGLLTTAVLFYDATVARSSGPHLRDIVVAAIPLVIGAFVAGVCLNMVISELRLPKIELQKKHSDDSIKGTLLSHSDGSWHLINSASDTRPLIAIPNERVFRVTIAEQRTAEQTTSEKAD